MSEVEFTVEAPHLETRSIDDVRPYWRNPRQIPEQAVAAVRDSIERYGYQQPIVVDGDGVIITGHTRYAALRQLGVAEIPVIVGDLPAAKAKEYRVLDNRVSEFSTWDQDALVQELREFEEELLAEYFPHIDLEVGTVDEIERVTKEQVEKAAKDVKEFTEAAQRTTTTVTCPECFHEFEVRADTI